VGGAPLQPGAAGPDPSGHASGWAPPGASDRRIRGAGRLRKAQRGLAPGRAGAGRGGHPGGADPRRPGAGGCCPPALRHDHGNRHALARRPSREPARPPSLGEADPHLRPGVPGGCRRPGPRLRRPARLPRGGGGAAVGGALLTHAPGRRPIHLQRGGHRPLRRRRGGRGPGRWRPASAPRGAPGGGDPLGLLPGHRVGHGLGRDRLRLQDRALGQGARGGGGPGRRRRRRLPGDPRAPPRRRPPLDRPYRWAQGAGGAAERPGAPRGGAGTELGLPAGGGQPLLGLGPLRVARPPRRRGGASRRRRAGGGHGAGLCL
jgi:hypothetical protein